MSVHKILASAGRRSIPNRSWVFYTSAGPTPHVYLDLPKGRAWVDNKEYTLVNSRARKLEIFIFLGYLGSALVSNYERVSSRDRQD